MRHARTWIGIAVSALFLVLLLAQVDHGDVLEAVRGVSPAWLAPALVLLAGSVWVRSERWRRIIRPAVPLTSAEATTIVTIGLAANNVFPLRAGEVVRAMLIRRRYGGSSLTAIGTIVVERVLDGLILASFLAGTVALAGGTPILRVAAAISLIGFGVITVATVVLGVWPERGRAVAGALLRPLPARIGGRVEAMLGRFVHGLTLVQGAGAWLVVLTLTALTWLLEAGSYWFVGQAFGLDLPVGIYLGVCAAANLAIAAPSTSGGIGPYEFFTREVVVRFGVPTATGTAFALVLHLFVLVPIAVAGFAVAWWQNIRVGALTREDATTVVAEEPA